MRRIGEKWGPVLSIDNRVDGLCSLTYARILVRTKAQNKIDNRIIILFDDGSCDVRVKDSSYFCGKYSMSAKKICVEAEGVAGSKTEHQHSVSENAKEFCTQAGYSNTFDPLISDIINNFGRFDRNTWFDPIVVNETAGWLMLKSNDSCEPLPQLCEGLELCYDKSSSLCSQSKKTRGRPKKKKNQNQCDMQTTPLSKSYLEALDTWNTAKLIDISSTEESVVISGLRKSKRLMIMDGKPV